MAGTTHITRTYPIMANERLKVGTISETRGDSAEGARQYLKVESELWVSLDPTLDSYEFMFSEPRSGETYLIAYPPQLAPAATARSGSIYERGK
jgi:hypothetical protein